MGEMRAANSSNSSVKPVALIILTVSAIPILYFFAGLLQIPLSAVNAPKPKQQFPESVFDPVYGNHVQKRPLISQTAVSYGGIYGGCIISDRMKFIYIKTAKSAGSTILLGWLRPSLCPPKNKTDEFNGWGSPEGSVNVFSKSCEPSILDPPPGTDSGPCDRIPLWKWHQYFVFATVRNPYERMRSSFTYCQAKVPWTQFCKDPTETDGCPAGWGGSKDNHSMNEHYQFPIHWAYHGWWGWHVDYIIRVEDIDNGIAEVARIVNGRAAEGKESLRLLPSAVSINQKPEYQNQTSEQTEKNALCAFYRGENSVCAVALEKTMDPQVLGYKDFCSESL